MRIDKAGAAAFLLLADIVGVTAGVTGCGKVSPPGSGVPIDSAPQEIATTVCPKAYLCCTAEQLMGNSMAGTDEPSCEMKTADAFGNQLTAVQTSQSDGRVRYDGDKLAACLAYIRSSSCETLGQTNHFTGIPGCDSFVTPLVADGDGCAYDWECTGGKCTDGKCGSLPGEHEVCASDPGCAAGLVCASTGLCVTKSADGGSCVEGTQCPSGSCAAGVCSARATTCFYASGCAVSGGGAAASLGGIAGAASLMALAVARRRRRRRD